MRLDIQSANDPFESLLLDEIDVNGYMVNEMDSGSESERPNDTKVNFGFGFRDCNLVKQEVELFNDLDVCENRL